jgi:hypothetical protein
VALKAANLTVSGTLSGGATQGVTLNPTAGTASAGLGVVALSVQSNEGIGGRLEATNEGNSVSLRFNNQVSPTSTAIGISAMTATLSGNLLQAASTANSASTGVTLEGANGVGLSGAVGNSQRNSALAVSATAGFTTPLAVSLTAGAVANSTLTLNSNKITAAATGNVASSSLTVAMANASGSAGVTATPPSAVADTVSDARFAQGLGDLTLANAQSNVDTNFTADVEGSVSLAVGNVSSSVSRSTLSLSTNTIGATVEINRALNTMALDVGNLSGMSTALASRQDIIDSVSSASTAGGVTLTADTVAGAALSANDNMVTSSLQGNAVANNLRVTGATATGTGNAVTVASSSANVDSSDAEGDVALASSANTIADVALANLQTSTRNTLSASTGDIPAAAVTMDVGAISAGSSLGLANNTIGATTLVNSATNKLALDITNVTGMTAGVASGQALTETEATATTNGEVGVSTDAITGSFVTLSGNAIAATVLGNSASNDLSLKATTASGRNTAPFAEASNLAMADGDFSVANSQRVAGVAVEGADRAVLSSTTTGTVEINAGANAVDTSTLTLSNNSVTADTRANSASNALALDVTTLTAARSGVASAQIIDAVEVTSISTGNVLLEGGSVTGSALTVSGNRLSATTLGNMATNALSLTGTNATGSDSVATGASAGYGFAEVRADVALANLQNSTNFILEATTVGSVKMVVGSVGNSTGPTVGSSLTLSNNTISALAQNNSATNTLALTPTNLTGMTAGVASSQLTDGSVTATASSAESMDADSAAFGIAARDVSDTPVVLANNTFSAVAGMNEAFNTLTAGGATLLGRGGDAASVVGEYGPFTTLVDFSVVNAQSGMGSVSALANPGLVGFTGSLDGGSLSIAGNTVLARASVNTASNLLTLAATNSLTATAVVNNVQEMNSSVSATVVPDDGTMTLGATLSPGGASTVSVSGNSATAQATGNLASNVLNASAVSGISGSALSTTPTFAVLNQQRTQATVDGVSAMVNGTTLGAALNGTGGTTSVQGNRLVALAMGNSADNLISMSALPGSLNTATVAINNVQYNMASITAAVNASSITGSGSVSGAGSVNVSGNTITAQVVGNRAVNSITAR